MKTFRMLAIAMMTVAFGVCFSSCKKEEAPAPAPEQQEYVTVNLGLAGEYVEISESPLMTRADGAQDLIAVRVRTITGDSEPVNYAWGIFTSLDNVSIKLLAGQKYKFETSIMVGVPDSESDYRYYYQNGQYVYCFNDPVSSDFTYSAKFDLYNFNSIWALYSGDYRYEYHHDRFYGELEEYVPENGGTVQIEAKRVAYGVRYIAEDMTEGMLNIGVANRDNEELYRVEVPSENPDYAGLYSFRSLWEAWRGRWVEDGWYENYYAEKSLNISWTKADGSVTPLGSYEVTFKRNVMTTIRIKVDQAAIPDGKGIVIVRTDDALVSDSYEYVLNGGKVTEVPVTQN